LGHVTLQQLQQHHDKRHTDTDEGQPASAAAADSYLNRLETDHAFASNHCVAAMAEQLGLSQFTDCLAGTLQAAAGVLPDAAGTDVSLKAVRQQIDNSWSKEAVWRGVGFAKEGEQLQGVIISCSSVKTQPLQMHAWAACVHLHTPTAAAVAVEHQQIVHRYVLLLSRPGAPVRILGCWHCCSAQLSLPGCRKPADTPALLQPTSLVNFPLSAAAAAVSAAVQATTNRRWSVMTKP
jgi:hypothetical protein